MVIDSTIVKMASHMETTIALLNGTIADPLRLPLPPNGGPKCTLWNNFATRAATWRIWQNISTRQLCAVLDVIISQAMSPFAIEITLAFVSWF